jgi:hypothetical protein
MHAGAASAAITCTFLTCRCSPARRAVKLARAQALPRCSPPSLSLSSSSSQSTSVDVIWTRMTAVSSSEQQQVGAGSADVGSNGAVLAATLWKATCGNTQCVCFKKSHSGTPTALPKGYRVQRSALGTVGE